MVQDSIQRLVIESPGNRLQEFQTIQEAQTPFSQYMDKQPTLQSH